MLTAVRPHPGQAGFGSPHALRAALLGLVAGLHAGDALARTWYVRRDRTGDAPTIQAALDSARPGDVVLVAPGTYTWTSQNADDTAPSPTLLYMVPNVTLRGEAGPEATILDAEEHGRVIACIDVERARIEGFTLTRGRGYSAGLLVDGNSHPTIVSCVVRDCS